MGREEDQRQAISDMVEAWQRLRQHGLSDEQIKQAIAPNSVYRPSHPPEGGQVVPLRRSSLPLSFVGTGDVPAVQGFLHR